ncbi:hypothetical protein GCM10009827_035070 [Dactylosporangium maewongense]|uniref:Uncharacterized protein n=1 Tax=Dactylosporangium maewongense TaxID=634393 RepID=A0ABP4L5U0_9ACTN
MDGTSTWAAGRAWTARQARRQLGRLRRVADGGGRLGGGRLGGGRLGGVGTDGDGASVSVVARR